MDVIYRSTESAGSLKTPIESISCFLIAALIGAIGQYFYKTGADAAGNTFLSFVINWRIMVAVVSYAAVMSLFLVAYKIGGEMCVLYPLYASTFIWASVISRFAFGTPITWPNVGGMLLLVLGMFMMGIGSDSNR